MSKCHENHGTGPGVFPNGKRSCETLGGRFVTMPCVLPPEAEGISPAAEGVLYRLWRYCANGRLPGVVRSSAWRQAVGMQKPQRVLNELADRRLIVLLPDRLVVAHWHCFNRKISSTSEPLGSPADGGHKMPLVRDAQRDPVDASGHLRIKNKDKKLTHSLTDAAVNQLERARVNPPTTESGEGL